MKKYTGYAIKFLIVLVLSIVFAAWVDMSSVIKIAACPTQFSREFHESDGAFDLDAETTCVKEQTDPTTYRLKIRKPAAEDAALFTCGEACPKVLGYDPQKKTLYLDADSQPPMASQIGWLTLRPLKAGESFEKTGGSVSPPSSIGYLKP